MPGGSPQPRLPLRVARGSLALVLVTFLDEIHSGIPFLGAPGVQDEFGLSFGQAAGWTLAAMGVLSLVLEPPVFLLADRYPRRPFVCGSLLACAATAALAALSPGFGWLLLALVLFGPASGWACGTAQATLMDANPETREKWMLRWALAGELGDLVVPFLLSGVALLGLGWRAAFGSVAVLWSVQAIWLWTRPFPEARERIAPEGSLLSSLRDAASNRALWPWLVALLLCDLMDETLMAFGALYLRDALDATVYERNAILGSAIAGGVVGLALAERWVARIAPMRLLAISAIGALVAHGLWLAAASVPTALLAMALVGFFASMHYPLVAAQAYRALPESSGAVNAVAVTAQAFWLPVPIALGLVADSVGLFWACALIAAQPIGLLGIALFASTRR